MKAGTVVLKTRLYLTDMNKAVVSDYHIYSGINDAMRMMAEESSHGKGELFRTSKVVTLSGNRALLPEHFITAIKAYSTTGKELLNVHSTNPNEGEFSIKGRTIVSGESAIDLWYFEYPRMVDDPSDEIEMPNSLLVPLAKVAAEAISGDSASAINIAQYYLGTADLRPKERSPE